MERKARKTTPSLKEEESPLRGIFCLKKRQDMKRFEETEDCFILDFDPFDSFNVKRITFSDDKDLAIIHETGQVACRDYPHPRHLYLNFPFGSTPNATYCDLCYCYICDKPAPCAQWMSSHCNASAGSMQRKLLIRSESSYYDSEPIITKSIKGLFNCSHLKPQRSVETKRFDETEDCFILDFDPSDSFDAKRLTFSDKDCEGDKDLAIIHETGQVACRDYPHPRHLCLNFPFGSTPNSSHCDLCYCYICDKPAPCAEWTTSTSHCNAYDSTSWNLWRSCRKTQ